MMRRSIALASAAGLALVLSACGGGGETSTDEPTEAPEETSAEEGAEGGGGDLVIWVDENRLPVIQPAADAFESETGTSVDLVVKNFEDIRADFVAQVPTGEGPDITVGAHDWLGEFMENGVVLPIELGDAAGEYNPVALAAFTWDSQVYGLPYGMESIGLIRNVELAPDAPADYDDMIAAGEAAGTEFPFLIQMGEEGDPYHMYPFQTSFGAPVFEQDADGAYTTELALGGENGHAFAEWLAAEGSAGHLDTAVSADIARQKFSEGAAPYIVGGPWLIAEFEEAGIEVAVSEIPSAGGETAAPFVGVHGFYVSAQSSNAIVANDFLNNYIGTAETQTALYEAGNRIPALTAAADAITGDPVAEGFAEVSETALPMPSIPEMNEVWAFWGVTQAQIVDGADPVSSWDKMVDDIQGAIDN